MFLLPAPTVPTLLITPLLRTSDGSHFSVLTLSLSSRRFGLLMIPQARQVCFRAFALAILPQLLPHTCVSLHFPPPAGIGSHAPSFAHGLCLPLVSTAHVIEFTLYLLVSFIVCLHPLDCKLCGGLATCCVCSPPHSQCLGSHLPDRCPRNICWMNDENCSW